MLNDHVYIGIVPGGWLLGDADVREEMREQWDGWAATGAKMMLRPNYMLDGHNMPMYAADIIGEHVRHCAQNGMIATAASTQAAIIPRRYGMTRSFLVRTHISYSRCHLESIPLNCSRVCRPLASSPR